MDQYKSLQITRNKVLRVYVPETRLFADCISALSSVELVPITIMGATVTTQHRTKLVKVFKELFLYFLFVEIVSLVQAGHKPTM